MQVISLLHNKVGKIVHKEFSYETLQIVFLVEWEDGGISWTVASNIKELIHV